MICGQVIGQQSAVPVKNECRRYRRVATCLYRSADIFIRDSYYDAFKDSKTSCPGTVMWGQTMDVRF